MNINEAVTIDLNVTHLVISVREGVPSIDVLQKLSRRIGQDWKPLGRALGIGEPQLTGFDRENVEYAEKPYKMLLYWLSRDGSLATYKVLSVALCSEMVEQRRLAEDLCWN